MAFKDSLIAKAAYISNIRVVGNYISIKVLFNVTLILLTSNLYSEFVSTKYFFRKIRKCANINLELMD